MNNYFKPSNILFYILSIIVCFFFGMSFARVMNAGRNQGLASGAIVLGYGILFAFAALIGSFVAVKFLKEKSVILLNKILAAVVVLFIVFLIYRILTINSAATSFNQNPTRLNIFTFVSSDSKSIPEKVNIQMGLGMIKQNFYEDKVFYFYSYPNFNKPISEHLPYDSLVFNHTELGVEISYAPPWFVPAHLKMDYEILYLRAISLHKEFIEVIVNETEGRTAYIDRLNSELIFWPEFLLSVFSVELTNRNTNPIRIKPIENSSISFGKYSFLRPSGVTNHWLQVELLDENYQINGRGWIKWHEAEKLIITYSLLS